jgi:hypothetical protein
VSDAEILGKQFKLKMARLTKRGEERNMMNTIQYLAADARSQLHLYAEKEHAGLINERQGCYEANEKS